MFKTDTAFCSTFSMCDVTDVNLTPSPSGESTRGLPVSYGNETQLSTKRAPSTRINTHATSPISAPEYSMQTNADVSTCTTRHVEYKERKRAYACSPPTASRESTCRAYTSAASSAVSCVPKCTLSFVNLTSNLPLFVAYTPLYPEAQFGLR